MSDTGIVINGQDGNRKDRYGPSGLKRLVGKWGGR